MSTVTLTFTFDDEQKAGILNAVKQVNLQIQNQNLNIQQQNLQGGEQKPLLPLETNITFIQKYIEQWSKELYSQMYSQRGQMAVEATKKLPKATLEGILTSLGVPPLVNLADWVDE